MEYKTQLLKRTLVFYSIVPQSRRRRSLIINPVLQLRGRVRVIIVASFENAFGQKYVLYKSGKVEQRFTSLLFILLK